MPWRYPMNSSHLSSYSYHGSDGGASVSCKIIGRQDCDFPFFKFPQMLNKQFCLKTVGVIEIGLWSLLNGFVGLVSVIVVVCQIHAVVLSPKRLEQGPRQRRLKMTYQSSDRIRFLVMDGRTDRLECEQNKTIVYVRADQYIANNCVCQKIPFPGEKKIYSKIKERWVICVSRQVSKYHYFLECSIFRDREIQNTR